MIDMSFVFLGVFLFASTWALIAALTHSDGSFLCALISVAVIILCFNSNQKIYDNFINNAVSEFSDYDSYLVSQIADDVLEGFSQFETPKYFDISEDRYFDIDTGYIYYKSGIYSVSLPLLDSDGNEMIYEHYDLYLKILNLYEKEIKK